MNKQDKAREIDGLKTILGTAPPLFVLGYRGLTVNQVSALRKKVRATSARYRVVKNRLALRVLRDSALKDLAPHFTGPTAIAWGTRDPAALAKALEEFTKDHQGLTLKAGYIEGRLVDVRGIKAIAALPAREVLVAQLLGLLKAPMTRLVGVLKGPHRMVVRALDEIARKKPAAGADGGTPAEG